MPSLFTARYPSGLQYTELADGSIQGVAIRDEGTLTEQLQSSGYAIAGIHSNPLLSNLFNVDRGFDYFDADLPFADFDVPGRTKLLVTKLRRLLRKHAYLPAETVTSRAIEWVDEESSDAPIFLWTHYMDVHGPYQSKTGFDYYEKFRAERLWQKAVHRPEEVSDAERIKLLQSYREEISYTDEQIGRLVDAVETAVDGPLVVVITADHGDGFGEHGYYSHPHELHEELIHVPLVVRAPSLPSGRQVDYPVELLDVAPTLLDIADVRQPDTFEGTSLRPLQDDGGPAISEAELSEDYVGSVRTDQWKYVLHEVDGREYLFDLNADGIENDPGSSSNHGHDSDEREQVRRRLRRTLASHRRRAAASVDVDAQKEELDDEDVQRRLRKLGYLE
jgi:arylsulfatase